MAPERQPIPNCKQTSLLTKTSWDSGQSTSAGKVAARSASQKRHRAHLRRPAHCTPRKLSGWDGEGDKSQPSTAGDYTLQGPGHLSCSDLGRTQTQAQPSLHLCGVPENLNLSGLDLGSACKPGPTSDGSRQRTL